MEFDSHVRPVWQLPTGADGAYIYKSAKYHCFVDDKALCGKHIQRTDAYDEGITVAGGEIARYQQIACKKCRERWLKICCEEDNAE